MSKLYDRYNNNIRVSYYSILLVLLLIIYIPHQVV